MKEFSMMRIELSNNIKSNIDFFKIMVKKNPVLVYYKLNELCAFVGSRYNLIMELHFPESNKIYNPEMYGNENISIIIDKFRKTFPIDREEIKQKAADLFQDAVIVDAYMYEGKEGVRVSFKDSNQSRIEILPGSFHLWVKIDENIEDFCNWLLATVYSERIKKK